MRRSPRLLNNNEILVHPFVIGELALGSLKHRKTVLETLSLLPSAVVASHEETLGFIEKIDWPVWVSAMSTRICLLPPGLPPARRFGPETKNCIAQPLCSHWRRRR
jgi:hypothetical protein